MIQMMYNLSEEEARGTQRLSQAVLNIMMDERPAVCQAAIITVAAIGCVVTAEGDMSKALELVDKLCLDIKHVIEHSHMMEGNGEDDSGVRN
jgi:lipoate synthase